MPATQQLSYDTIENKRIARAVFLNKAFDMAGGRESSFVNLFELGDSLGLTREDTSEIYNYLQKEYLLEAYTTGGQIKITHYGIKEIEEQRLSPEESTAHFPPLVQIIQNTGTMSGVVIQQGSDNSGVATSGLLDSSEYKKFIEFAQKLKLESDSDTETFLEETVDDLEQFLKEGCSVNAAGAIEALKSIATGMCGSIAAAGVLKYAPILLATLNK